MKKIFLAIALLASVAANAQQQGVKSIAAAQNAVKKAIAKSENPKQAEKPDTWIKLGKAYLDAYAAPMGAGWIGAPRQELALILGEDKPVSEEWVSISGQDFIKAVFETRDYYYNSNEILQMIIVTKPIVPDALDKALEAYVKAASLDANGKKAKDLKEGLQNIARKFTDEAYNAYTLGDLKKASDCFEKAAAASEQEPNAQIDTNAVYNTALTAYILEDYPRAKANYEKCLELKYYGDEGDAFAKLADIASKEGDKEAARNYLETAFQEFPQSQGVLVGLINFYMSESGQTDRLFELVEAAKKNEPNNASLYYVEGNINNELGREEAAIAAYSKCYEINPEYEFGFIGIGQLLYNKAVAIQEQATNEMDDAKYNALVEQFEQALKGCIEPFEKAFAISKDAGIKKAVSEYLKNACYRFSGEDVYLEKYRKYDGIVKGEIPVE